MQVSADDSGRRKSLDLGHRQNDLFRHLIQCCVQLRVIGIARSRSHVMQPFVNCMAKFLLSTYMPYIFFFYRELSEKLCTILTIQQRASRRFTTYCTYCTDIVNRISILIRYLGYKSKYYSSMGTLRVVGTLLAVSKSSPLANSHKSSDVQMVPI